ncbi:uncharacterized protein [Clytia hemisphaerica]|uniref:uncharacterized protein n=1 Tax=Clytia hemisphaerica TaxID=252671 RepID=UPI0034D44957
MFSSPKQALRFLDDLPALERYRLIQDVVFKGQFPFGSSKKNTSADENSTYSSVSTMSIPSRKRTLDEGSKDTNKKPVQNDEKSSSSKSSKSSKSDVSTKKCSETTTKTSKKDSQSDVTTAQSIDNSIQNFSIDLTRRIRFTKSEEQHLLDGVKVHGAGNWSKILEEYNFHPSRTNVSLKDNSDC